MARETFDINDLDTNVKAKLNRMMIELYSGIIPTDTLQLTDGTTSYRLNIRSSVLFVDKTLTATGFSGDENIDWENVTSFE